jgi:hypothetical protein
VAFLGGTALLVVVAVAVWQVLESRWDDCGGWSCL